MAKRDKIVDRCIGWYDSDAQAHKKFADRTDELYRAYRGVIEWRSEAASWTNKQHPPYIFQVIETLTAGMLDPRPRWRVRARPRMAQREEIEQWTAGAKAHEMLLNAQLELDHFVSKQRPFALQALIASLSVLKTYWHYETGVRREWRDVSEPIMDEYGGLVGESTYPKKFEVPEVVHDRPTMEVVDVRFWIPHEAAISVDRMKRCHHLTFHSYDELKLLERNRDNPNGIYTNVDDLKEEENKLTETFGTRENEIFDVKITKDMIAVIETWFRESDGSLRVVTTGNKKVKLADRKSPFDHNEYPFIAATTTPDLFRISGISEVEMIKELQEMVWSLSNQRLDNLQLINNAIILLREDFDDPDAFEFFPGARNVVSDPQQVVMWSPNPVPAQVSLEAEQSIRNDLQAIPGASPALLGQDSGSASTATEVSLTANLGQRRLSAKKQSLALAYKRAGEQWMDLNQQFIREPQIIELVGPDGVPAWEEIHPEQLAGRYHIDIEELDESLMRNERLAQAQAKYQIAVQSAPVMAATQTPLNLKAFMDDVLDAYDVSDKDRYYSAKPQQAVQQQGLGGPQQAQGTDPSGAAQTAPQATDQSAPSNAFSMSPVAADQRMTAMAGGPVNASGG